MGDGPGCCYLGVDAGATRCRARLRGDDGVALAEAEGPAANPYVNFERAVAVARGVVEAALARAGLSLEDTSRIKLGLGVAGVGSARGGGAVRGGLRGFRGGRASSTTPSPPALARMAGRTAGSSSSAPARRDARASRGRETIVGGRGFHLGDDGSAARLGLEAARAAMRAADGLGPETDLTRQIRARFPDPLAMLHWAAAATPRDYGEFAPLTLEAAAAGDALARGLVGAAAARWRRWCAGSRRSARRASRWSAAWARRCGPFSTPQVAARILTPLFDPTDGAIALVGGTLP